MKTIPDKFASDRFDKIRMIIEASQKRFGLYGIEKTSMREIAGDLKLSKASLYYYFPDKESLYKAVVEKEHFEFIEKISQLILSIDDPERLLIDYAIARVTYFRNLLNLGRIRLEAYSGLKPVIMETIRKLRENEKEIVKKIFEKGIKAEIFFIEDIDTMAGLFLDLLKGLRMILISEKKTLNIEIEDYALFEKKTIEFTNIFTRGLKNRN